MKKKPAAQNFKEKAAIVDVSSIVYNLSIESAVCDPNTKEATTMSGKKILSLLMTFILVFSLAACGGGSSVRA
ncbi:MAG: hypothetical protein IKR93_00640, partial [Firmicutes bacterium]|nr:hypothetical protein [Bacillota bacterium]